MKTILLALLIAYGARAEEALVQSPEGCLESKAPGCFVKTQSKSARFDWNNHKMTMGPESVLGLEPAGSVRLLLGNLQVDSEQNLKLTTSYAAIEFTGAVWVQQDYEKTWIRNLTAQKMSYTDSKDAEKLGLPVGFEIWISKLDAKKQVVKGVAQPLLATKTLLSMQNEFGGGVVSTEMIKQYLTAWQGNAERASEQYQALVQRQMASFENREKQKQKRFEQEQKSRESLRELFRRRNNGTDLSPF